MIISKRNQENNQVNTKIHDLKKDVCELIKNSPIHKKAKR